jgi:hypothetical protein
MSTLEALYYIVLSLLLVWAGLSPLLWYRWQSRGWEPSTPRGWSAFYATLVGAALGAYLFLLTAIQLSLYLVLPTRAHGEPWHTWADFTTSLAGLAAALGSLTFLWICYRKKRSWIEEEEQKRLAEDQSKARLEDWQRGDLLSQNKMKGVPHGTDGQSRRKS